MAPTAAFLATCQTAIPLLPECVAFRAALASLSSAGDEQRQSAWNAIYNEGQAGGSLAHRLRRAIRDVIANAQAASDGATPISQADSEAAYQQLTATMVPESPPPQPPDARTPSLTQDDVDSLRLALIQMTGG